MFEPKIRNRQTDLLIRAILLLDEEEAAELLCPACRAKAEKLRCPACGRECDTLYIDARGEVAGCEICIHLEDAYEYLYEE